MRKQLCFGLIGLACAGSYAAPSDRWALISDTHEHSQYIDSRSVVRTPPTVQAWLLTNYTYAQGEGGLKHHSTKFLQHYHCKNRTIGTSQAVYYAGPDATGNAVTSWSHPVSKVEMAAVVPDSLGELQLDLLCSGKKTK